MQLRYQQHRGRDDDDRRECAKSDPHEDVRANQVDAEVLFESRGLSVVDELVAEPAADFGLCVDSTFVRVDIDPHAVRPNRRASITSPMTIAVAEIV